MSVRITAASGSTTRNSKFKPSTSALLPSFSTPGFQAIKGHPAAAPTKERDTIVYVSSDSAPSTPGPVKRDSSGLSLPDEQSPNPPKRQKKIPSIDKENALPSSKPNLVVPRPPPLKKYPDLDNKPMETLIKLQLQALTTDRTLADQCLAFHKGNPDLDIVLLDEFRKITQKRLEAIEATIKARNAKETCREIDIASKAENTPVLTPQTLNTPNNGTSDGLQQHSFYGSVASTDVLNPQMPPLSRHDDDEDDYWAGMPDIPMDIHESANTETSTPTSGEPSTRTDTSSPLTTTKYYPEALHHLKKTFRLSTFRKNQLEAITATLEGKDVFVLMPTGGGKSLCFQLPAVCTGGETRGVTVVVSPLIALMKDQVDSLVKKNIDALVSNSELANDDWQRLVRNESKPKLWYITPEKLRESPSIKNILNQLHRQSMLARFVIDEAHCISTWGQDFREAYTYLGDLRENFDSVPIMALTATANQRTIKDIVSQLKLRGAVQITQSFNRDNLHYYVQSKKAPMEEIKNFISTNHRNETGVIYCNSRKTCEDVAKKLRDGGFKASHYHAGLPPDEKSQIAQDWQNDVILIIVATIAFGMGIDKADVRFVIHHDMPKSLSGYYQETGRAGRDGKPANCLTLFSVKDLTSLKRQIQKNEEASQDSKKRQFEAVKEVFQFCVNISLCRRVQILQHFDEKFSEENCGLKCDNCVAIANGRQFVKEDVTQHAQVALRLVSHVRDRGDNVTLNQLALALRGSNQTDIKSRFDQDPQYGSCSKLPSELLELMLSRLVAQEALVATSIANKNGFHTDYLELGETAESLLDGQQQLVLDWHRGTDKPQKQRKKAVATDSISAAPRSRKGKQKAVEEDPIESSDDLYLVDQPTITRLAQPKAQPFQSVGSAVEYASVTAPPSNSSTSSDSVEILYNKMLNLRHEIAASKGLEQEEVFDDSTLQYLSAVCPADYNSFKSALANCIEVPHGQATKYIDDKWDKYGQRFLELCIQKNTGFKGRPVLNSGSLFTTYEYRAHNTPKSEGSTPVVQKLKSKFKPAKV